MSTASITVFNPATGAAVDAVAESTPDDVDTLVRQARAAFPSWAATPAHARHDLLAKAAQSLLAERESLAELLVAENGKPYAQALDEVTGAARLLTKYGQEGMRLYGETIPGDAQPGTERDLIFTKREPRGVLGAIIAFNSPMDLFAHKVGPALASGNCVVLKPAEVAPLTVMRAVALLHRAGIPEHVLQTVNGYGHTVVSALANHPGVDVLSLTGSTAAGLSVAAAGVARLTPVMLELGGNDPLIVLPDADLDLVMDEVRFGRTLANGQICCANKRLLVHDSLASEFTERLLDRVAKLHVGDPSDRSVDLGPLITEVAASRVAEQVGQAVSDGATLATGSATAEGTFFQPTVLTGVAPTNPIAGDVEVFGPVFPVVTFDTERRAVEIANRTQYGLNASIFTRDTARALYVAHHLQAGTVSVNATGLYRPDAIDYGGYKMSGFGREGLRVSFHELTQVKTIALRGMMPAEASGYPADF